MQAWGDSSRFSRRATRREPTKSGVLGLLAAARGQRRTDPIEDLAALRFGVRIDQPGQVMRDFQTARTLNGKTSMPISQRYYLADAVFVAAVEGETELISGLQDALREPSFPLCLGRRSFVPSGPLNLGVSDVPLLQALCDAPWQAAPWHRKRLGRRVSLELDVDAEAAPAAERQETVRDVPLSFDPERREYGWRDVAWPEPVSVDNPTGRAGLDFMGLLGAV
jgi:CRISPR system Cascade subunit CasD